MPMRCLLRSTAVGLCLCGVACCTAPLRAEAPPLPAAPPPNEPSAAAIARELYRLQQARGGSIVPESWGDPAAHGTAPSLEASGPPPEWSPHRPVEAAAEGSASGAAAIRRPPGPPPLPLATSPDGRWLPPLHEAPLPPLPGAQATVLRETAIQLDAAANRLEAFDLYEQADGLRAAAQRLRRTAREFRERELQHRPAPPPFDGASPAPPDEPR